MKDIEGIDRVMSVLKPHWEDIEETFNQHNQRFLDLAAADHDVIGRVLRSHLIIENFLDTYLSHQYQIEELESIKLSFLQKTKLLPSKNSSAAFIRPGIMQLNAVRNKFGHRLNHQIQREEISAIYEVLAVSRPTTKFEDPILAIEAFTPIACAFLSVHPTHIENIFMEAFKEVQSHTPFTE